MVKKKQDENDGLTLEERELLFESERLRDRALASVLLDEPATSCPGVPVALKGMHGADIIKKNTPKKLKYLTVFPGAVSIPQGAKVGELQGLNGLNPTLVVEGPTFRIKFRGTILQSKNSFFVMKPQGGKKSSVVIQDVFQSIIAFSEWEIDGEVNSGAPEDLTSFWKTPAFEKPIPEENLSSQPKENGEANEAENGEENAAENGEDDAEGEEDGAETSEIIDMTVENTQQSSQAASEGSVRRNPKRNRSRIMDLISDENDQDIDNEAIDMDDNEVDEDSGKLDENDEDYVA